MVPITYGNHDSEDEFVRSDIRRIEQIIKQFVEKKNSFIVDDLDQSYTLKFMIQKVKVFNMSFM